MNLIYNGNVEITLDHTKRYRNKGTIHLFRLFASLMAGDEYKPTVFPYYIMLYDTSPNTILTTPNTTTHQSKAVLNRKVILHRYTTEQQDDLDTIYSAVFDTSITREYLNNYVAKYEDPGQRPSADNFILTLALISQEGDSILAAVPFSKDEYDHIVAGGSAIIKWSMSLTNGGDE